MARINLLQINKILQKNQVPKKEIATIHPYKDALEFATKIRKMDYAGGYAYLQPILQEQSPKIVICKGSQLGFSEALINVTIWHLLAERSVLYLLPTESDVTDFSASRFNPVISSCECLNNFAAVDNVRHKIFGKTSLFLRGARSKNKLKSIPVAVTIIDEYDEMIAEMIELARERLAGSSYNQEFDLSTPSLADVGIFKEFRSCDQKYWAIPCCHCGSWQILTLESNVNLEAKYYFCSKCKKIWKNEEKILMIPKGEYVIKHKGNAIPGYHVSQIYSPTVTAQKMCEKIIESEGDETKKQVLYNSKLGLPYEAKGSRLTGELFDARVGEFNSRTRTYQKLLGVDVSQSNLHYCCEIVCTQYGIVLERAFRATWEDLLSFTEKDLYEIIVIDANPERYKSRELVFAANRGFMALYSIQSKDAAMKFDEDKRIVDLPRTPLLDEVFSLFTNNRILIKNHAELQEFKSHCCNTVRCYREVRGTHEAYYAETGPDHYLHALAYALTASKLYVPIQEQVTGTFI